MNNDVRRAALAALATATLLAAGGCAPLVIGGAAAGGVMVASDRRSPGVQFEDQAIELRLRGEIDARFPTDRANISITSYNQRVLLTGEATTAEGKAEAQAIAARSKNVLDVRNELHVGSPSTLANRNFDTSLTAKVLAVLAQSGDVPSGTVKVVSERSVVYLMGVVTKGEGAAAARAASRVTGVRQVVAYFDYVSESEVTPAAKTK